ncbi:MAG: outer membrane beta-barrel protein [Rhodopseudomonas sp.]|nr:outer membrane beta-barrel protein [Rhodopseudomonas sp.]
MKRLPMTIAIGLFAAALTAPALAADLPTHYYKAPVFSAPHYNWTGFYAGVNVGYGFGKSDWSGTVTNGSTSPKGALAGGTLGYNLQTGSLVWGLEADIDYSWAKGSDSSGTGGCTSCETKNSWLGTARGRIGYAAWDRWLPFITGGAAFGDVKMAPSSGVSESETKFGWTVGGGVEYALQANWTAKVEYLYADLGNANCSAAACTTSTDVSYKTNIVRAGLNYRF